MKSILNFKNKFKLKLCSTNPRDIYGDDFELLSIYVRALITFYTSYTNRTYPLDKLDIVILPSDPVIDLLDSDFQMTHFGIIYLSSSYLNQMNSNDQLTKVQNKLKLLNMIAKQLSKHWSFDSFELNCEKSFIQSNFESSIPSVGVSNDEYDIVTETTSMVKNYCDSTINCISSGVGNIANTSRTMGKDLADRSLNSYLELNEKCFLYKGFINWISYMAFQAVQPDLFDLVSFL